MSKLLSSSLSPAPPSLRRSLSARPWDAVFWTYFALHIPISLLMDFQALAHYPIPPLIDLADWYTNVFGDVLMRDARTVPQYTWFWSFVVCELFLQLPVFVYATQRLWSDTVSETTRMVLVIYGTHVATTLVPILASVCSAAAMPHLSLGQRVALVAVYCPFLLVPLLLVWRYGFRYRDMVERPLTGGVNAKLNKWDTRAAIHGKDKEE